MNTACVRNIWRACGKGDHEIEERHTRHPEKCMGNQVADGADPAFELAGQAHLRRRESN